MKVIVLLSFILLLCSCSSEIQSEAVIYPKEPKPCSSALEMTDRIFLDKTQTKKEVIFSKEIEASKGDTILVQVSSEVTNDLGHDVMVGYYVQRTLNGETKVLRHAVVGNVTPNMHHWPFDISRLDFIDEDGLARYDFIMYAAAMVEKSWSFIIVEQCYGGMDLVKL